MDPAEEAEDDGRVRVLSEGSDRCGDEFRGVEAGPAAVQQRQCLVAGRILDQVRLVEEAATQDLVEAVGFVLTATTPSPNTLLSTNGAWPSVLGSRSRSFTDDVAGPELYVACGIPLDQGGCMRGRRLILSAVTVLVAVLGLAPAAHATDTPPATLACTSEFNRINCRVLTIPDCPGGESDEIACIIGIDWGGYNLALFDFKKRMVSFPCFTGLFGRFSKISVTVTQKFDPTPTRRTHDPIDCVGGPAQRQASNIVCRPTPTAAAQLPGGNYIACGMIWSNDGSPMTIRWPVSGPGSRQPVVTTNSEDGWTQATFNCNNPGGPDLTFFAYVIATDAAGSMVTPVTIPCGW